MVTRDFVDNKIWLKNADWRNILLHPWIPVDFTNQKIEHIDPSDDFFFVSSFSLYLLLNFFASFFNWHKIIEILEFFSLNDFCKFQEEHIVDILPVDASGYLSGITQEENVRMTMINLLQIYRV